MWKNISKNTNFCGVSHAHICSVVAEINGLSAVKNGFRAHKAHLGWIKISTKKKILKFVEKKAYWSSHGMPRLMVFPLLKTVQSGSKYLKFQELKGLSVSKDYATSENSYSFY